MITLLTAFLACNTVQKTTDTSAKPAIDPIATETVANITENTSAAIATEEGATVVTTIPDPVETVNSTVPNSEDTTNLTEENTQTDDGNIDGVTND